MEPRDLFWAFFATALKVALQLWRSLSLPLVLIIIKTWSVFFFTFTLRILPLYKFLNCLVNYLTVSINQHHCQHEAHKIHKGCRILWRTQKHLHNSNRLLQTKLKTSQKLLKSYLPVANINHVPELTWHFFTLWSQIQCCGTHKLINKGGRRYIHVPQKRSTCILWWLIRVYSQSLLLKIWNSPSALIWYKCIELTQ